MSSVVNIWDRLFLQEKPSISLSFVRIIMALTTIFYIAPTLCQLEDNYFPHAFKTFNPSFLPLPLIEAVQQSPVWLIVLFVWIFAIASFFFLIGLFSRASCIVTVLSCYYFQALNNFHIGSTLSWDILLVTLFLFCLVPYHGDYFSADALLRGREDAYKKRRPYFIQRLLQLHVGFMYFYTALYKITAEGNWLKDNPLYYVLNYPPSGVTKYFLVRDFLMTKPVLCYWLGVAMVFVELTLIFFLFWRRTRITAIYISFIFHITLLLTLDVPAILFFVFPALCLLFVDPDEVIGWIEAKRSYNRRAGGMALIYDGHCPFCRKALRMMKIMDLFDTLHPVNFRIEADLTHWHTALSYEKCEKQFYFVDMTGKLYGGFFAFRKMALKLPMLWPMLPLLYLPGMGLLGPLLYKVVSTHRSFFNKILPIPMNK